MTSNIVTPQGYESVQDGLPNGWIRVTIGEISKLINSGFPSGRHNQEQIGVPHLRPMNVSPHGTIDLDVVKYVELEEGKQYDFLVKGDVLFNNTNSPDWLGKTAFIESDTNWVYSNHMTRIRLHQEIADSAWVAYALHNLFNTGFFRLHCRNHVNQASINAGFLANEVQIPLAPLAEQKRIVDVIEAQFTRLDAAVAGLQRLRANLQRYRQSVLKAACEGRLVPTEAELAHAEHRPFEDGATLLQRILAERRRQWEADNRPEQPKNDKWKDKYSEPAAPDVSSLPELPDGWSWATVEQVSTKVQYGTSEKADVDFSGVPVLRMGNIQNGRLDFSALKYLPATYEELDKYLLEPGDVLFNRTNSAELVGKTAVYQSHHQSATFASYLIRVKTSMYYSIPSPIREWIAGESADG